MSWELGSLLVLGIALLGGFAWYEITRPAPRTLALVATLGALAALGRIAFAPIPNVKPTTDIVLISGFALGGAPGFVVGAVAALASNVVFGQGPWTPWQMFAWGLVGVLGAGIGALSGRRIGRLQLAAVCGIAGAMYGVILDGSTWAQYSGTQTLDQYLAISATSLPFNIAHVVGNVIFALAFGPLLVRSLLRFRERLEPRWAPLERSGATAAAILVALVLAGGALAAAPPGAQASAASRAAAFLAAAQHADGGWGPDARTRSSSLYTGWATIGLGAYGGRPAAARAGARFLEGTATSITAVGDVERTLLALRAAGASTATGGLALRLRRAQRRDGSFGRLVNLTSFGVLALRAAGEPARSSRIARAAAWIRRRQFADGGFSFSGHGRSGVDDTAAALQALRIAEGRRSRSVRRAAAFLVRAQSPDGGYGAEGGPSNAQSTAFAIQGLLAAGRDPDRPGSDGARSPLAYLRSLQQRDGSVRYSRTSTQTPVWVTAQALAAFAGRTLPVQG